MSPPRGRGALRPPWEPGHLPQFRPEPVPVLGATVEHMCGADWSGRGRGARALESYCDRTWAEVARRLVSKLRARGEAVHDAEDLAQEAITRVLARRALGHEIRSPEAYMWRTAKNLRLDSLRARQRLLQHVAHHSVASDPVAGRDDAAVYVEGRDLHEVLPSLVSRMPPPYGHIAALQAPPHWTRRQIHEWLRGYRPVSDSCFSGLMVRTHTMLRLIASGGDAQAMWPGRYQANKNPWILAPLPPMIRLRR